MSARRSLRGQVQPILPVSTIAKAFLVLAKIEHLQHQWFSQDDVANAFDVIFELPFRSSEVITGSKVTELVKSNASGIADHVDKNQNDFGIYLETKSRKAYYYLCEPGGRFPADQGSWQNHISTFEPDSIKGEVRRQVAELKKSAEYRTAKDELTAEAKRLMELENTKKRKAPPDDTDDTAPAKQSKQSAEALKNAMRMNQIFDFATDPKNRGSSGTLGMTAADILLLVGHVMEDAVEYSTSRLNEKEKEREEAREAAGFDIDEPLKFLEILRSNFSAQGERNFVKKNWNDRNIHIAVRSWSENAETFVKQAKKTKWIENFFPEDKDIEGICLYLSKEHADIYESVGKKGIRKEFSTAQTLALSRDIGMGQNALERLKQWMKPQGVQLHLKEKEVAIIDREVGVDNPLSFGIKDVFLPNKDPQPAHYWNLDLPIEVATEL
jgi:hypothetical protein